MKFEDYALMFGYDGGCNVHNKQNQVVHNNIWASQIWVRYIIFLNLILYKIVETLKIKLGAYWNPLNFLLHVFRLNSISIVYV